MPKVSEEYAHARRQEILSAAWCCFAQKGFHKTTMRDICEKAGLSSGAVYSYFKSKEDIFAATATQDLRSRLHPIESAKDEPDIPAHMAGLIDRFTGDMGSPEGQTHARLAIELWSEALSNEDVATTLREVRQAFRGRMQKVVERLQAEGLVDPSLPPHSVVNVMASIHIGLVVQQALGDDLDTTGYAQVMKGMTFGPAPEREASTEEPDALATVGARAGKEPCT